MCLLRACGDPAGRTEWFPTEPFYYRNNVRDPSTTGVGTKETDSTVHRLYRSHQSVRLRGPNIPVESTNALCRAAADDFSHPSIA